MPEYYVGIDLGTTNTAISVLRRGQIETLRVEGEPICPSVVGFQGPESYLVGRQARRRMMIDPEHTLVSPKRKMGRLKFRYRQHGREYSPTQISALILKKVKEAAEQELGPLRKAVITVPAYFNEDQRAATKEAGELAGFEVLRLLSEPTAAAIAYGLNQGKDQTIAVYDLGGGTFDISILEVKGNTFTVKAVGGNHHLGGDDFDRALSDHVEEELRRAAGIDLKKEPRGPELLAARQRLKEKCEEAKIALSEAQEVTIEVPNLYRGRHLEVTVTRKRFEALILPYIAETVRLMVETLKKARLGKEEIDRVILVGGSTCIPLVRRTVAETLKEPYIADNVMEMVTRGAAIVAAQYMAIQKKGDEGIREVLRISSLQELDEGIREIYPYRLGIATASLVPSREAGRFPKVLGGKDGMSLVGGAFSQIVELGQKVPLKRRQGGFTTLGDHQREVQVEIYRTSEQARGEVESCKDLGMQFLGDFHLRGIPPAPAGVPQITVTMEIDDNGLLRVRAELEGSKTAADSAPIRVDRDLDRVEEEEED